MRRVITDEEKVAHKLKQMLDSVSLDLEKVGFYFSRMSSNVYLNRLAIIYDSAEEDKEKTSQKWVG